jgi:SPP1 family predicted phage head-tail adaptor
MSSNASAGEFDRRIEIQRATETKDSAGDPIPSWARAFDRWAKQEASTGGESTAGQQVVREADTVWILRSDGESQSIAPETNRIRYRGVIYEIVSITPGRRRADTIEILTSSRPDKRGARAQDLPSGSP